MGIFEKYVGLYPVQKTLRFSLVPINETEENIKKYGMIEKDSEKAEYYHVVKDVFDKYHKMFIENVLNDAEVFDWEYLFDIFSKGQKAKDNRYTEEAEKYRKLISNQFKKNKVYKIPVPADIVKQIVKNKGAQPILTETEVEAVLLFNRFATYFEGYRKNRDSIYECEQGSISYRIINENFPKFANNIKTYQSLSDDLKREAEIRLADLLEGNTLADIFTPTFFSKVLSQHGIEYYNRILGGVSVSEEEKKQGFNELLNEFYQHNRLGKKIRFVPLFKQILSDREQKSFIPDSLINEEHVLTIVREYSDFLGSALKNGKEDLEFIFKSNEIDLEKIYVDSKQIPMLSRILFDNQWNVINDIFHDNDVKKKKLYTLSELCCFTNKQVLSGVWEFFELSIETMNRKLEVFQHEISGNKINQFEVLKDYLDSIQECEKILKIMVAPDEADNDMIFYSVFDQIYEAFRKNISVYNMVRNYVTKKPYSTEKYKLNFECPTLADGWDQNKEYQNNTMLFIKDNKYYLGVLNPANKPRIIESINPSGNDYRKMIYKLLPSPHMMLPKTFFSKTGIEKFGYNEYISRGYEEGKYKKGENFDIDFCHGLIDYYKECIQKHEDWSKFGFKFSDTKEYSNIADFYKEISKQNYKLNFLYVNEDHINELVQKGQLFLFQIYNKDFSTYSSGLPNLHTMYWKELFSEENLQDTIFKLNGQAEIFFRPASVKNPFVHKQGSILISKNDVNNNPIDKDIYEQVMREVEEGKSLEQLQEEYPLFVFKTANYDITKDKRYTKDSYSFHVPLTINYAKDDMSAQINKMVLQDILEQQDVNIIGIDRGERNLLYVSVIDQKGNIKLQKSFNIVSNAVSTVNYHKKLDNLEKSRDKARKNWKQISNIKEMKEGYLSAVVKEITDLMLAHNAIIVMEDLNFGFKKGRFRIEKQVYQKFEKMLIEKLNYLVSDKKMEKNKIGSVRHGYQLTPEFKTFQSIGKQMGFVFYVPAAYTSKIDPITGFVNLFTSKQLSYHSINQSKGFVGSFKSITYDEKLDGFKFEFAYSDFDLYKTDYTNEWTVYSCGKGRLLHTKKDGHDFKESVDVTERLKTLFVRTGIDYRDGDLKESILAVSDKDFYKELIWLFKAIVQLRYEDAEHDFILSPVLKEGKFFDSREQDVAFPQDGDANGAYHIALQGLRLLTKRIKDGKIVADETGMQAYNWFEFIQKKEYKG